MAMIVFQEIYDNFLKNFKENLTNAPINISTTAALQLFMRLLRKIIFMI